MNVHLTSPFTTDATTDGTVTVAQKLLHDNRFKVDFLPGKIDGVFKDQTAEACQRARWHLGYRRSRCTGKAGRYWSDELRDFLLGPDNSGKRIGSPGMLARFKYRRRNPNGQPVREKALAIARKEVGTRESPAYSNRTKYNAWYGAEGAPWCAIFITWCYVMAKTKAGFRKGSQWSFVNYIVEAAKGNRDHLRIIGSGEVQAGDLVAYYWKGFYDTTETHIAMFVQWMDRSRGVFEDLGGNTGDQAGGEVAYNKNRTTSIAHYFIRVEK